jgi:hypothetical protein
MLLDSALGLLLCRSTFFIALFAIAIKSPYPAHRAIPNEINMYGCGIKTEQ